MSIFNKKEKISVKDHFYHSLLPVYKFDPTADFIRTSEPNLLTPTEMERLINEDRYLLTALQYEMAVNQWGKGNIENLPRTTEPDLANEKIGYWLGFVLPFELKDIYGEAKAEAQAEVALAAVQEYLGEFTDNPHATRQEIFETIGMVFAYRVLGQLPSEELQGKRYYYTRMFGENLCIANDKELKQMWSQIKLVYTPPQENGA